MAKTRFRQLTYADLEQLPEDISKKHELFEGELIVSPSPRLLHQLAVTRLILLLDAVCPPGCRVLTGPLDWYLDERNVYVPDLVVACGADFTDRYLASPPLLAVEVLSPSNRAHDLVRKRHAYAQAGLDHYWIVDPEAPTVTVLDRVGDRFDETAMAKGEETLTIETPVALTLCPADLIA
jgi:Uma2 family endonuclease